MNPQHDPMPPMTPDARGANELTDLGPNSLVLSTATAAPQPRASVLELFPMEILIHIMLFLAGDSARVNLASVLFASVALAEACRPALYQHTVLRASSRLNEDAFRATTTFFLTTASARVVGHIRSLSFYGSVRIFGVLHRRFTSLHIVAEISGRIPNLLTVIFDTGILHEDIHRIIAAPVVGSVRTVILRDVQGEDSNFRAESDEPPRASLVGSVFFAASLFAFSTAPPISPPSDTPRVIISPLGAQRRAAVREKFCNIVNLLSSLLAGFRGATAVELKLHAHNLFFPPDYEDLPRLPSLKFSPLAPALTLVIAVSDLTLDDEFRCVGELYCNLVSTAPLELQRIGIVIDVYGPNRAPKLTSASRLHFFDIARLLRTIEHRFHDNVKVEVLRREGGLPWFNEAPSKKLIGSAAPNWSRSALRSYRLVMGPITQPTELFDNFLRLKDYDLEFDDHMLDIVRPNIFGLVAVNTGQGGNNGDDSESESDTDGSSSGVRDKNGSSHPPSSSYSRSPSLSP